MASICIFNSSGDRICYSNHAAKKTIHYVIYYAKAKSGRRGRHPVAHGTLPPSTSRLEKLAVLLKAVRTSSHYNSFKNWRRIRTWP